MKHYKFEKVWILVLASTLILGGAYYYGTVGKTKEKEPEVYSIILYQNTDNEWETLMDGIEQAKKDYRLKIRYMTLAEGDTAEEQADIMEQEALSGVNGIIYAAVDSKGLREQLQKKRIQVPMISVETGTGEDVNISAENYEMGRELGKKILQDMEEDDCEKTVTVVCEFLERDSVSQRYHGLIDELEESEEHILVNTVKRQKGDFNLSLFMGTAFPKCGNYVVTLDKFSTQETAKAWLSNRKMYEEEDEIKFYGIGNTAQTVSDLDGGLLTALVFQNEFNMGYKAVKALLEKEKMGYMEEDFEIKYKLVTRDTLYEPENERLLFPNS